MSLSSSINQFLILLICVTLTLRYQSISTSLNYSSLCNKLRTKLIKDITSSRQLCIILQTQFINCNITECVSILIKYNILLQFFILIDVHTKCFLRSLLILSTTSSTLLFLCAIACAPASTTFKLLSRQMLCIVDVNIAHNIKIIVIYICIIVNSILLLKAACSMLQQSIIYICVHRHKCHKLRAQFRCFNGLSFSLPPFNATTIWQILYSNKTIGIISSLLLQNLILTLTIWHSSRHSHKHSVTLQQNIVTIVHLCLLRVSIIN